VRVYGLMPGGGSFSWVFQKPFYVCPNCLRMMLAKPAIVSAKLSVPIRDLTAQSISRYTLVREPA
jgi:hypothetical protein